jgi:hypothetical protein
MTLAMPRPGRPCRCLMDAAGPGSWPGGVHDAMNASDVEAAGRSALTGLVLPLVIPSQGSGTDAAGGSACAHLAVPAAGPAR